MRDIWLRSIRDLLAAIFLLVPASILLAIAINIHSHSIQTNSTPVGPIIPFFYLLGLGTLGASGWFFYSGIALPAYALDLERRKEEAEREAAENERRHEAAAAKYAESR